MATHKEYTLTVKNPIYQSLDKESKAVYLKPGMQLSVKEEIFNKLKSGETISFLKIAGQGMYASVEYDKYNFENEVECLTIETYTSVAKLGQRAKK